MKKLVLLVTLLGTLLLTGCAGENIPTDKDNPVKYQIMLNSGSCFVYTFQDTETGVWYISTSEGVYPRLNIDGSLYVEE